MFMIKQEDIGFTKRSSLILLDINYLQWVMVYPKKLKKQRLADSKVPYGTKRQQKLKILTMESLLLSALLPVPRAPLHCL